jgi:hypothetical protein
MPFAHKEQRATDKKNPLDRYDQGDHPTYGEKEGKEKLFAAIG